MAWPPDNTPSRSPARPATAIPYSMAIAAPSASGIDLAATDMFLSNQLTSTTTQVTTTISNLGNVAAGSFQVEYFLTTDGNAASPGAVSPGTYTISGLAAGGTYSDVHTFDLSSYPAGAYQLVAVIDPQHLLTETTTADNTQATGVAILPAADSYQPNYTMEKATTLPFTAGQSVLNNLTISIPGGTATSPSLPRARAPIPIRRRFPITPTSPIWNSICLMPTATCSSAGRAATGATSPWPICPPARITLR